MLHAPAIEILTREVGDLSRQIESAGSGGNGLRAHHLREQALSLVASISHLEQSAARIEGAIANVGGGLRSADLPGGET